MAIPKNQRFLKQAYQKLFQAFGPQHWWPGETKLEIIVGAILTQNTNWKNVETAIQHLKTRRVLKLKNLNALPVPALAEMIRPAGYYNIKAARLKNMMGFLTQEYHGHWQAMQAESASVLRQKLLGVKGVGPETADSILLYAFDKPIFVVDTYTRRFLVRHQVIPPEADYAAIQDIFHKALPLETQLFNEYHALIVRLGKVYCRTKPLCAQCPLNCFLRNANGQVIG